MSLTKLLGSAVFVIFGSSSFLIGIAGIGMNNSVQFTDILAVACGVLMFVAARDTLRN